MRAFLTGLAALAVVSCSEQLVADSSENNVGAVETTNAGSEDDIDLGAELAKSFVGGCVQILPEVDLIERAAALDEWEPIDGDAYDFLAPTNVDANWRGWLINRYPAPPHFMFISEGVEPERSVVMCGVANPYAPPEEVIEPVSRFLSLGKPELDQVELGRRTRMWKLATDEHEVIVMAHDISPMEESGLTLSAMIVSEH